MKKRISELLTEIEHALLEGAHEPSEREAGFSTTEDARLEAYNLLEAFLVQWPGQFEITEPDEPEPLLLVRWKNDGFPPLQVFEATGAEFTERAFKGIKKLIEEVETLRNINRQVIGLYNELTSPTEEAIIKVKAERQRQNKKWGVQNWNPSEWIAILTEEVGEAAKEAVDYHHQNGIELEGIPGGIGLQIKNLDAWRGKQYTRLLKLRAELVQVAAVAVQAIESLERNEFKKQSIWLKKRKDAPTLSDHLKHGDKVTYKPTGDKGILKGDAGKEKAFVVFSCEGNWEDFEKYTGESCQTKDLRKGWED